jgi:hypothetical protein
VVSEDHHAPERPTTIHVIVTCANRKSLPIPPHLRLGEIHGTSAIERARTWIARLADTGTAPQVPASDLYAGEHWSVARRFADQAQPGEDIRLWACSAGYGLIPAEARIMPYHATLTPGQADSVPGCSASWWTWLSEWPGPAPEFPRSIEALVASDPAALFIFVLSKNYLGACGDDIAASSEHIADPDRLLIVSAGARLQGTLAAFAVPADARLQAQFSGTRRALNARIGLYLLSKGIRSRGEAVADLNQLRSLDSSPSACPRHPRRRRTGCFASSGTRDSRASSTGSLGCTGQWRRPDRDHTDQRPDAEATCAEGNAEQ